MPYSGSMIDFMEWQYPSRGLVKLCIKGINHLYNLMTYQYYSKDQLK